MIALTISRRCDENDERSEMTRSRRCEDERSEVTRSVKQRRSQSYSQHSQDSQSYGFRTRSVENLTGDHCNHIRGNTSKSSKDLENYNAVIDNNGGGAGAVLQNIVATRATLHNQDIVRQ